MKVITIRRRSAISINTRQEMDMNTLLKAMIRTILGLQEMVIIVNIQNPMGINSKESNSIEEGLKCHVANNQT